MSFIHSKILQVGLMSKGIKLNSNKILAKEFSANVKGYCATEVDAFLDVVIQDYEIFEEMIKDYQTLKKEFAKLKESHKKLAIENAMYKRRLDGIKENDNNASYDNLELYKRISALEKALYVAGIDPTKVK